VAVLAHRDGRHRLELDGAAGAVAARIPTAASAVCAGARAGGTERDLDAMNRDDRRFARLLRRPDDRLALAQALDPREQTAHDFGDVRLAHPGPQGGGAA